MTSAESAVVAQTVATEKLRVRLRNWVFSRLLLIVFRTLKFTWRIEEDETPESIRGALAQKTPFVLAHLHEDEWALIATYASRGMNVLVSLSADGGVMSHVLEKLNFRVARGSSSRGGASGFLSLLRNVKKASYKGVCLAIDGPRGPRRKVKPGIFKLAESLKAPIVLMSAYADKVWIFQRSWSHAFVPKPYARVRVSYLPGLGLEEIQQGLKDGKSAELGELLEKRLNDAKSLAKQRLTELR